MKKISNLGLPLTRQELKTIVGGDDDFSGCSINCSSGYYACCSSTCRCIKNGDTAICFAGGPGAISCSYDG